MLTSAAQSDTSIAHITPIRRATHTSVPLVVIDVTVPGTSSAEGRRALHAALGEDLRLYIMTVDRQRECVTFRVEVTSHTLDDVIGLLISALDSATLGHAQASTLRRPRNRAIS
jgi:hypothetical protein